MKSLISLLDRLWFAPMAPFSLAVCRIATGSWAFYFLLRTRAAFVRSAGGPPEVFHPIGVARVLDGPLSISTYDMMLSVCVFLCALFTAGLLHRVLAPIFAALFLFVLTYSNSWAMVFHTENMLVLHVCILAITPSAAVLSMDASFTSEDEKYSRFGMAKHEPEPSYRYKWPIRLMQLGATLPYVVAGVAKVNEAGWSWSHGGNLRDQITMNGLYYEVLRNGAEPITFHVYGWDAAFLAAASMTLVLELGAPLALLHRYVGYLYVAGIMSMHWSILFLMGIPFPYQLYGYAFACFFVWDRPAKFLLTKWDEVQKRIEGPPKDEAEKADSEKAGAPEQLP
jgi:hypothetical protein